MIGGRRLLVQHIGAVTDLASFDGLDERDERDEFAAAGVDDDSARLEKADATTVYIEKVLPASRKAASMNKV
jgi:hypothetical protein